MTLMDKTIIITFPTELETNFKCFIFLKKIEKTEQRNTKIKSQKNKRFFFK